MNAMKFTGKVLAVCLAAGITAAAISACDDKKPNEDPAAQATTPPSDVQTPAGNDSEMPEFNMKPASEEEVLTVLAFLPDPLATIDGEAIPRKLIVDDIISQELPLSLLESIDEETLRGAMKKQIEAIVKEKVMLKLAADAGFKPSAEFVEKEMKEEFEESSKEEQEEIEDLLKARGTTVEEHMKTLSQDPEVQKIAALRKYTHTTFLDKAKKEVTDDDIKKEYQEHIKELTTPEGVTVAHILIQPDDSEEDADKADAEAKAKIDAIYEELLKDPSQFAKLAVEKSDCPSGKASEGKLPSFDKDGFMLDGSGAMDQTFTDAAFGIEKDGQITKPVKTRFGYHIIKRIEKVPEDVVPLEKVKERITEHLIEHKAQEELDKAIDEAMKKANVKFNDFAPAKPAADAAAE